MNHIFISYRREDAADVTGRIHDRLRQHFGEDAIFTDVDKIPLGVDFRAQLDDKVSRCKVLLPVIGRNWLAVKDHRGQPRLQDPDDFVRLEIESALRRDIPVIPLLVHGIEMPSKDDLPDSLQELAYRNGTRIRPDPDFHKDMDRLISALEQHLRSLDEGSSDSSAFPPRPSGAAEQSAHADLADLAGLADLYTEGLSWFYTENWDRAVEAFEKVIAVDADFEDVARKHQQASRQQRLVHLYEQAGVSTENQAWGEAVRYLEELVEMDAGYRDAETRLQEARLKLQMAHLYGEAQRLRTAEKWQAAITVLDRIASLDSSYPDPDGIRACAQEALDATAREAELAKWYRQALRKLDQGRPSEALQALEAIEKIDRNYRETEALLIRVRQQLAKQEAARKKTTEQKKQLASVYEQVKSSCAEGDYAEAAKLIGQIENIDSDYQDIQSIKAQVGHELKLARRFRAGLKLFQSRRWDEAIDVLEVLRKVSPDYHDPEYGSVVSLLAKARSEKEKSSLPEPPTRVGARRPSTFPEAIKRIRPVDLPEMTKVGKSSVATASDVSRSKPREVPR